LQGKAPVLRCIYPFLASTQSAGRPGFGCGFVPSRSSQAEDHSTCATLAIPAVTAPLWLENYRRFGSDDRKQCSLSTQVASEFKASLEAHNGVDAAHTAARNELLIATWPEDTPEALPIEAFFYNLAPGELLNAQQLRHAYFLKTSLRLPIVRVDFTAPDKNIFTWRAEDQLDGWDVADGLNARFNDGSYDCGGQAAYYCSGVFLRMTGYGSSYHSWNPNPATSSAISFSFIRRDMKMTQAVYAGQIEQGYIFKAARHFEDSGVYPLKVLCSFPYDAGTVERTDKGCGENPLRFPEVSRQCKKQGINTVEAWHAHYTSQPIEHYARLYHQCGFDADREGFALSLKSRVNPEAEIATHRHNEVLIDRWPQDIPGELPIEAFAYVHDPSVSRQGLDGAKYMQADFYEQTGKVVPIVGLAFESGGPNLFVYSPDDQAISK
jgi:hypothetical protein